MSAAIRDARIDSFPVVVTAFITQSEEDQRSQFILVNSAKPLPKGLIYELLPATSGALPLPLSLSVQEPGIIRKYCPSHSAASEIASPS